MTIEERMDILERELTAAKRRNRWLVGLAVVALMGWAITSGVFRTTTLEAQIRAAVAKEIRAERFTLVDSYGHPNAVLSTTDNGPMLVLYGKKGNASLGVNEDGPAIQLNDEKLENTVFLRTSTKGPSLSFYDKRGGTRINLFTTDTGPSLAFYDKNGKVCINLNTTDERPSLNFSNKKGSVLLAVNEEGPAIQLNDEKLENTVFLSTSTGPSLSFSDKKGSVLLAVNEEGPAILLDDENKNNGFLLTTSTKGPQLTFFDESNDIRTELGTGELSTPDGKTITYPASSIRLWGPNGKMIWQAP